MTLLVVLECLALLVLLILSGFFSSAEVAYFYLDPLEVRRIGEDHPQAAERVEGILQTPTQFLSTILIGNTAVNVAVSVVTYSLMHHVAPANSEVVAVPVALFLLLIFGEIGPKRIAVRHAAPMALRYAPLLQFFIRALKPFRVGLEQLTQAFSHWFATHGRVLSEEEFETVVDLSGEHGVLDQEERKMVKGILRMEELQASDVMTPRVDIIGIDIADPDVDPLSVVRQARVRRLLVYREEKDQVVGLLDCRRFLLFPDEPLERSILEPLYVPETCPLDKLLARFIQEQKRTAVVVGEYGGTSGLISRGDILEEVTGDIDDEKGAHELLFTRIGPRNWLMDGRISLEKLTEEFGIAFEEEGVDRISGWMAARLERIPRPGDVVEVETDRFTTRQMRRNRVTLVELLREGEA